MDAIHKRLAYFVARHTFHDPNKLILEDGAVLTFLKNNEGRFLRFAVTDEEIEASRRDPNQIVIGPLDVNWRQDTSP